MGWLLGLNILTHIHLHTDSSIVSKTSRCQLSWWYLEQQEFVVSCVFCFFCQRMGQPGKGYLWPIDKTFHRDTTSLSRGRKIPGLKKDSYPIIGVILLEGCGQNLQNAWKLLFFLCTYPMQDQNSCCWSPNQVILRNKFLRAPNRFGKFRWCC